MACTLTQSPKPGVDFEGTAGNNFTITIVAAPGSTLAMTAAVYNGTSIGGSSATFLLASGKKTLTITYASPRFGERGDRTERCSGGGTTALRGIRSTAIFTRIYIVEG